MIGKLKGIVDRVEEDHAIIDVGGVGYVVHCTSRTLGALPAPGEAAALEIETHVRDDAIRLYGFRAPDERAWFRALQGVQGVGAKVALAILSALTTGELAAAVHAQDRTAVARAQGVGPKLAQRIVAELKDKAPAGGAVAFAAAGAAADAPSGGATSRDALAALVNLGYARTQAAQAVAAAARELGEGAELSALIKRGLRELAR
ncbi:MAG: Holliday junction branch migration protein RuvA [Hyphomicrobiales bacterium]|nr:Holliday junction branch migration protein RuvA [Hyphomicrobiales bacterium]MDE2016838.1 Holliday junction branch migration protein RuvA [Hyphomicrobiales bacterium]